MTNSTPAAGERLPCPECDVIAGLRKPPGGEIASDDAFVVHAVLGASPLAGWTVIVPRRHVESIEELSESEQNTMMRWGARVTAAQRTILGSAKSYLALFAEVVPHVHLHVVPRYADTPDALRGARVFLAPAGDARSEVELVEAAERLRKALAG